MAGGNVDITVLMDPPSTSTTSTVDVVTLQDTATAGVDYGASEVTVTATFSPGETPTTVQIPILDDAEVEPNETFSATLQNNSAGTLIAPSLSSTVVTIIENDVALVAVTSLDTDLDGTTAVVEVSVDSFKDPSDDSTSTVAIESFTASLAFGVANVEIVDVIGVAGFGATTYDSTSTPGTLTINATPGGAPVTVSSTPKVIAKIAVRLIGSALSSTNLTTTNLTVTEAGTSAQINQDQPAAITFTRGNTRANNETVDIFDALFIAQCLAGTRDYGSATTECNPTNAASVRHDGASGDRVSIFDALFIAQYKAGLKDDKFQ